MAYLTNGTLNYNLTLEEACCARKQAYIRERNMMDPNYPDPNDPRFTDPAPVFTILDNQLYRDGVAIGRIYNNKTGRIVGIDTITEDSFSYKDTSETAIISRDISVTTVSKLTGLKNIYIPPYQGFCKLTLSNGDIIELEGSGEISGTQTYPYRNSGVTSVELGKNCTSIGGAAFNYITTLSSITIPNTVTVIGPAAFQNCSSLSSITIPNTVTTIKDVAFQESGLIDINIPDSVTSIGVNCFDGSKLRTAIIGNGITTLTNHIFRNCFNLTDVTISDSVTNIGNFAFNTCRGLTSITIPDSVTNIGDGAFYSCTGLTSITIPDSVTSIGQSAFYNCSSLASITSLATTAPTIQNNTFQSVKTNGTLYVPHGSTGYDTWMSTSNYYLGKYNWTKVELS